MRQIVGLFLAEAMAGARPISPMCPPKSSETVPLRPSMASWPQPGLGEVRLASHFEATGMSRVVRPRVAPLPGRHPMQPRCPDPVRPEIPEAPTVSEDHIFHWVGEGYQRLELKHALQKAVEEAEEHGLVTVGKDTPVSTLPFTSSHRGYGASTEEWCMQQVAARDSQLEVFGRNIADRLQVIKGLPMTCLVLSHDGGPPDEITGYHSATLAPLHCYWVRGYSGHVAPQHRRLADGHQVFQAWKAPWEWSGWRRLAPGSRGVPWRVRMTGCASAHTVPPSSPPTMWPVLRAESAVPPRSTGRGPASQAG